MLRGLLRSPGFLFGAIPTRKVKDLAADMIISHDETADRASIYGRLKERFERIGLDAASVLDAYPVQLPAGTKQRVVIGISTLLNPKVVTYTVTGCHATARLHNDLSTRDERCVAFRLQPKPSRLK